METILNSSNKNKLKYRYQLMIKFDIEKPGVNSSYV
jgi:hypothetical protein